MAPLNLFRRRTSSERGAELIEFALVLPLLLLVVLGIVDFGFLFQRFEVVTNAAREGARIAVLPGYQTSDVIERVTSYLTEGGLPPDPDLSVVPGPPTDSTLPSSQVITTRQVVVTYHHQYLFLGGVASWFGGSFSSVPLSAVSTMRCEQGCGP